MPVAAASSAANPGQRRGGRDQQPGQPPLPEVRLGDRGEHPGGDPGRAGAGRRIVHGHPQARACAQRQAIASPITPPRRHHDPATLGPASARPGPPISAAVARPGRRRRRPPRPPPPRTPRRPAAPAPVAAVTPPIAITGTATASATARDPGRARSGRGRPALVRGAVARADAQVAGAGGDRPAGGRRVPGRSRRARAVGAEDPTGRGDGQVVRADVAAVGADREGDVQPVVDQAGRPVRRTERAHPAGPGRTPRGRWSRPRPGPGRPGRRGPPGGRPAATASGSRPGSGVGDQMQSAEGRHVNSPPCAGIIRIRFDGRGLSAPLSARCTGLPWVTCL